MLSPGLGLREHFLRSQHKSSEQNLIENVKMNSTNKPKHGLMDVKIYKGLFNAKTIFELVFGLPYSIVSNFYLSTIKTIFDALATLPLKGPVTFSLTKLRKILKNYFLW